MENQQNIIGRWVREQRKKAGLTQKEAAEKLGISYQTLSQYERNPSGVKLGMLQKMSELYGIPIEFIFFK